MSGNYIEDKCFDAVDFTEKDLASIEYQDCQFINCVFANANLSGANFGECVFENCDLSMAKMEGTVLREVKFKGCKLLGVHFDECNEFIFSVGFEGCQLNLSSFFKLSIKNTTFKNCNLQEADFTASDLTNTTFADCDLSGAAFENTILEKADLRSAYNFSIDPEQNKIKKAKFSMAGLPGLLDKYNIVIEN